MKEDALPQCYGYIFKNGFIMGGIMIFGTLPYDICFLMYVFFLILPY